jgi:hypothetical protein
MKGTKKFTAMKNVWVIQCRQGEGNKWVNSFFWKRRDSAREQLKSLRIEEKKWYYYKKGYIGSRIRKFIDSNI